MARRTRGAIPVLIAFAGDKFIDGKLIALTHYIERHVACAHSNGEGCLALLVHRSVSQGNPGAAPNGSPAGVERCVVRYPMTNHSGRCLRQELLHSPVRPAHLPLMNSHRNSELVSPG